MVRNLNGMINQVWLDCKQVLEIEDYSVICTVNYNSRLRKIK